MLSKQDNYLIVQQKYILSFDNIKIYIIIVCWEDIYSHYSIQSSNNDYFYP